MLRNSNPTRKTKRISRPVSEFFLMDFICLKETSGRTDVEKCGIAQEEGLTTLAIPKHSGLGKVTVLQC